MSMDEKKSKRIFPKQRLPDFTTDIRSLLGDSDQLPPVQEWHPSVVGDIDIRIAKDGGWFYRGEVMSRVDVVKLLSSILRKDDEEFFLVTPTEKMRIQVEDAPFVVNMMDVDGSGESQKLHFSTQLGDCFTLSPVHPLRVIYNEKQEPSPYLLVRDRLEARVSRQVYYEMADLCVVQEGEAEKYGLWSDDCFYPL